MRHRWIATLCVYGLSYIIFNLIWKLFDTRNQLAVNFLVLIPWMTALEIFIYSLTWESCSSFSSFLHILSYLINFCHHFPSSDISCQGLSSIFLYNFPIYSCSRNGSINFSLNLIIDLILFCGSNNSNTKLYIYIYIHTPFSSHSRVNWFVIFACFLHWRIFFAPFFRIVVTFITHRENYWSVEKYLYK